MKILFGVFDWGLGHATRDIPIIEALLKQKHSVDIISTGRALQYLKLHFKDACRYFDVPSVASPYTKTRFFTMSFIYSTPKMLKSIKHARAITERLIAQNHYDKVISDCRYDVYDTVENSYLIAHQLRFKSFYGGEYINERWLTSRMNKYKAILVPDYPREDLTGVLSHNLRFFDTSRVHYIGVLSHVKKKKMHKDIDYFITLSGPEPQRTILEKQVLKQAQSLPGKVVMTAGTPDRTIHKKIGNVEFHSFLNTEEQQAMLNRARTVIARAGYTTIMDLYELGIKDALLIPTPGQTEQEYLSKYYEQTKRYHFVPQKKLNLKHDLSTLGAYSGFQQLWNTHDSVKKALMIIEH